VFLKQTDGCPVPYPLPLDRRATIALALQILEQREQLVPQALILFAKQLQLILSRLQVILSLLQVSILRVARNAVNQNKRIGVFFSMSVGGVHYFGCFGK
jgi:hypothetical protein